MSAYDRDGNPDKLNVWQIAADGIEWADGGRTLTRFFEEKGVACEIPGMDRIAVLELRASIERNEAYLIDRQNNILSHASIPLELQEIDISPYDIYLSDGLVEVLFENMQRNTYDYRVNYEPLDFSIVSWNPTK